MSTRRSPDVTEADVERLAAVVGLDIDASLRLAVAQQLAALLAAARLFDDFALPDTVEPAPTFRP